LSPIDCDRALREVERYLDRELEPAEMEQVASHLEGCPPCMRKADFQRKVHELIARSCGCDELPQSMHVRIQRLWVQLSSEPD
jgi:mycothiol system anti-sigma-R factor